MEQTMEKRLDAPTTVEKIWSPAPLTKALVKKLGENYKINAECMRRGEVRIDFAPIGKLEFFPIGRSPGLRASVFLVAEMNGTEAYGLFNDHNGPRTGSFSLKDYQEKGLLYWDLRFKPEKTLQAYAETAARAHRIVA